MIISVLQSLYFALRQKWKNRTIFSVGWLLASNGKSRWHSGGWGGLVGMWSVWKTVPSKARVTRDEVSGSIYIRRKRLSGRQYLNNVVALFLNSNSERRSITVKGYCLPDSSTTHSYTPETSSRVTLALLGIGFQPNLVV